MIEKTNSKRIISKFLKKFKVNIGENPFAETMIYKYNKKVVGLISYSIIYEKAEINYIYVLDSYRRKGIATELINALIFIVKDLENITLEVNINNSAAIKFYKKLEFNEIAIRPNYYGSDDAILMLKNLGE